MTKISLNLPCIHERLRIYLHHFVISIEAHALIPIFTIKMYVKKYFCLSCTWISNSCTLFQFIFHGKQTDNDTLLKCDRSNRFVINILEIYASSFSNFMFLFQSNDEDCYYKINWNLRNHKLSATTYPPIYMVLVLRGQVKSLFFF